jgi:hypothetical protein
MLLNCGQQTVFRGSGLSIASSCMLTDLVDIEIRERHNIPESKETQNFP